MFTVCDPRIPLAEPRLNGNEWVYVKQCLDTNWISSVGPFVDRFEQAIAQYLGTDYAVATSSGTAALHVALLVAGVEANDEVLVSTLSFIAPANAIRYVGAWPIFMDAEPKYWEMDAQGVIDFCERACYWRGGRLINRRTERRVRAIVPVHILGHPVDMDPILEVARTYKLAVVEDATESFGSRYKSRMVGCLGDIGCLSFNGNKLISTGGGGMIVTSKPDWAERAKYLTTQARDHPLEYIHNHVGYNYRMTNVQAAIGCAQMERVEEHISAKRHIAARYASALAGVAGVEGMVEASWAVSVFWLYTVLVDDAYGLGSRDLQRRLAAGGIESRPLWQPLHLSPAHSSEPLRMLPVAERLNRCGLSLPSSVALDEAQVAAVAEAIAHAYGSG